jgi:hypothetical protein
VWGRVTCGSAVSSKHNLEKHVILQTTVLLHLPSPAVQEGVMGEMLGHPRCLTAPAVHWQHS